MVGLGAREFSQFENGLPVHILREWLIFKNAKDPRRDENGMPKPRTGHRQSVKADRRG